jgi:hypothetical protein
MVQLCPRCQRANPSAAVFCHFDGYLLKQGAAGASAGQMAQEFVFPSGRRCRTWDDLVQGCYNEWEEACELLRNGAFLRFLGRIGRADLSRAAQEAQTAADPDLALLGFVEQLPSSSGHAPRLDIHPRRLIVGPLRVGEQRPFQLTILNQGKGLLQGKVKVAAGEEWLQVPDSVDGQAVIRTAQEQVLTLRANTVGLKADQSYTAKLMVVSNGGVAEVPMRLDLKAAPFLKAPYQGAHSPRDMAERMRANPKPAVALLESGEISRWFQVNGWAYPVVGGTAPGLAAVQQFFEGLGLSKYPTLTLSDTQLRLQCKVPETSAGQITLRAVEKRWVYVQAESSTPWLKVSPNLVSGSRQVTVPFEIDSSLLHEDGLQTGVLTLIANGGQRFAVEVEVNVTGNPRTWFGGAPRRQPVESPVPVSPPARDPGLPAWLAESPVASTAAAPLPAPPSVPPAVPLPRPTPGPVRVPVQQPVLASVATVPAPTRPPAPLPLPAHSVQETRPSPAAFTPLPDSRREPITVPAGGVSEQRGGVLQALVVGALLGCLLRVVLLFPADLWARLLGSSSQTPVPGTVAAWLLWPTADDAFLRLFVLATWWVGSVVGVLLAWRNGGRWLDLVFGALAGTVAGAVGAATVACLQAILDGVPRFLLGLLVAPGQGNESPVLGTLLWVVLAVLSWTVLGAVVGLCLRLLGQRGTKLLTRATNPVSWLLRLFHLRRAADFFAFRGG